MRVAVCAALFALIAVERRSEACVLEDPEITPYQLDPVYAPAYAPAYANDGFPYYENLSYVFCGRDPRDGFPSMMDHVANGAPEIAIDAKRRRECPTTSRSRAIRISSSHVGS